MKPDDLTLSALPEPALHHDNETEALSIANDARKQWNDSKKAEISAARLLETDEVQEQMATEIFAAVMAHLDIVPRPVKEIVIAKFHAVNLPKRMTAR